MRYRCTYIDSFGYIHKIIMKLCVLKDSLVYNYFYEEYPRYDYELIHVEKLKGKKQCLRNQDVR